MSEHKNDKVSSERADRNSDDPWERMQRVVEELRPEWEASRERSKRALAEADAALKLRSR